MFNNKMYELGSKRSVIRELFEYGKKRAREIGEENVFDFSLGNPNVPAPECVNLAAAKIISEMPSTKLHGYTSAQGDVTTRQKVAEYINERFITKLTADSIYMTCGAAASLCITLKALCKNNDDEFIVFAPFFPEYTVFIEAANGVSVVVPAEDLTFQPDMIAFRNAVTKKTKAVIINSPNNPSGVVYTKESIETICAILKEKSAEYGHPIFIISDEPYREIVYGNVEVPYLMNYYNDVVVCYSFSKSLSLPGERIGYIAVSDKAYEERKLYAAVCGAGRALGYVCAPSLFQYVVAECLKAKPDVAAYGANRDLLLNSLQNFGYNCVKPDGAFYLFVKSPEEDASQFCERAKTYGLLLVPGDDFYSPGYVRIAYCVSYDMIVRSLPAFKALMESYTK